MVYALERLATRNSGRNPLCLWKQYARCANQELLEKIRQNQPHPEEWRVMAVTQKSERTAA